MRAAGARMHIELSNAFFFLFPPVILLHIWLPRAFIMISVASLKTIPPHLKCGINDVVLTN